MNERQNYVKKNNENKSGALEQHLRNAEKKNMYVFVFICILIK